MLFLLFRAGDAGELAERMGQALDSKGLERMGREALSTVKEHSMERVGAKLEKLYMGLLKED